MDKKYFYISFRSFIYSDVLNVSLLHGKDENIVGDWMIWKTYSLHGIHINHIQEITETVFHSISKCTKYKDDTECVLKFADELKT